MFTIRKLAVLLFLVVVAGVFTLLPGAAVAQTANLSIATVEQVAKVPGVTPELAKAILDYKAANGFTKPDDLMKVPGMTPQVYEKLKPSADKDGNIVIGTAPAKKAGGDDEEEAVIRKY